MTKKITSLKVERYKNVYSTGDHSNTLLITDIIEEIKGSEEIQNIVTQIRNETDTENQKNLKKSLPFFQPCIIPPCTKPYETNGIIQLDIDKYDIKKSTSLKAELIQKIPSLVYTFISPKGGLKFAILTDLAGQDSDTFAEGYFLVEEEIGSLFGRDIASIFDKSCRLLSQGCYLSFDPDAYFNDNPEILLIADQVKGIILQKEKDNERMLEEQYEGIAYDKPENGDVHEALSFIPSDYSYDQRLPINFAVLSHFGSEGIQFLEAHWDTPDRKKLRNDLKTQLKSHNKRNRRKYSVNTLFFEAIKHGYKPKPPSNTDKGKSKGYEPSYSVDKLYTPEEATEKLKEIISDFLETKEDTAVLCEAGAGKTWSSLKALNDEHLKRKRKFKVAYFTNTKKIADERRTEMIFGDGEHEPLVDIPKIIQKLGGGVSVIKGYGEDTCPLWKEGNVYSKERCDHCSYKHLHKKLCPYEHQYLGYRKSSMDYFRIYQHTHLFQPSKLDKLNKPEPEWMPDVLVVDEDVVSNMIELEYVKKGKYGSIDCIIDDLVKSDGKNVAQVARAYYEGLKIEQQKLFKNKKIEELEKKDKALFQVLRILKKYATSITIPQASVWVEEGKFLYVGWIQQINKKWQDIPMLYLDASGNERIISKALKRKFKFHKIRCQYQDNVEVVQVQNNVLSKWWCNNNREKIQSLIDLLQKKPTPKSTGVISYKKVKSELFISDLVEDENTCGWFGKLRGSNQYKNMSQLLVFGRHFVPTDELIRIAKIMFRDWDPNWCSYIGDDQEPLPFNDALGPVEKTIRMKDGNHLTVRGNQYLDWRLHELSEHLNKSETYQALHRLRLVHDNEMKQLVYASKEVNDITVDRLVDDTAIFITDTRREFVEAVYANNGKIKLKSNKQIAETLGKTVKQVAKMKENNKEWMENNIFYYVDKDGYCVAR